MEIATDMLADPSAGTSSNQRVQRSVTTLTSYVTTTTRNIVTNLLYKMIKQTPGDERTSIHAKV
jgi:hypothetical protein